MFDVSFARNIRKVFDAKGARAVMRGFGITLSTMLVFSGLVVTNAAPAAAAPEPAAEPVLVSGTVYSDANGDNNLNTAGAPGTVDLGVEGVDVTLRCEAPTDSNHAGWVTTTDANGFWSFPVDAVETDECKTENLFVEISTKGNSGDLYAVHDDVSTDNDFAKVDDEPQLARTAPFSATSAPTELNALVWPTWELTLVIPAASDGFTGKAIRTGSAPWDDEGGSGYDQSDSNDVVRSGDLTSASWSIARNAEFALSSTFTSGVFEQTIHLGDGALANFATIPPTCLTGSPESSIWAYPGDTDAGGVRVDAGTAPPADTKRVVLTCNLGEIGISDSAILIDTSVWASPQSKNGSKFTSSGRAYGVDGSGAASARHSDATAFGPIEITSMPRYDLVKHAPFSSG